MEWTQKELLGQINERRMHKNLKKKGCVISLMFLTYLNHYLSILFYFFLVPSNVKMDVSKFNPWLL